MDRLNQLSNEKSPYLLQHASNPVNWYAWGDEAFEKAKKQSKPVFLSIGYSTCHWCHVMERESFENQHIAKLLNRDYISIKVDREELPDVDRYYMDIAVKAGWGGGWPLSVWLTPDRKPFFGGTYFPPESRQGMTGFADVLMALGQAWEDQHEAILDNADALLTSVTRTTAEKERRDMPEVDVLDAAYEQLRRGYDSEFHGFGNQPKFPMPVYHDFLLGYSRRSPKSDALDMSTQTLSAMVRGGIYDQVGFGFHRYSTDAGWHVPHFEKMLYDNAQLVENYVQAWQITKNPIFKRTARQVLLFVMREMTDKGGGFYSAQDADSVDTDSGEKSEGAFYLWKKAEIDLLPGRDADVYSFYYGIQQQGNAQNDPFGEFTDKNIPYQAKSIAETAAAFKLSEDAVRVRLDRSRDLLYDSRKKRPAPALDDKIIVSWNALMISAFARAGRAFANDKYIDTAVRAAGFIRSELVYPETGNLCRYWRNGPSLAPGTGEDYVFLCRAYLDLYESTFNEKWIDFAIATDEKAQRDFFHPDRGVYYMNAADDRGSVMSPAYSEDNVIPSANSIGLENQIRLAEIINSDKYSQTAEIILRSHAHVLKEIPTAYTRMLNALQQHHSKPVHIVVVGAPESADTRNLLSEINSRYIPHLILCGNPGHQTKQGTEYFGFATDYSRVQNQASAYVCMGYECRLPVTEPEKLAIILDEITE